MDELLNDLVPIIVLGTISLISFVAWVMTIDDDEMDNLDV